MLLNACDARVHTHVCTKQQRNHTHSRTFSHGHQRINATVLKECSHTTAIVHWPVDRD